MANKTVKAILVLALVIAISTSIYGLVETLLVGDSIQKAGCSAAIVADDLLFGNKPQDGSQFFSGFYAINEQIGELQDNLEYIADNFSILMTNSTDPTVENALRACQKAQNSAVLISSNEAAGSPLKLSYPAPINNNNPTYSVQS
jgi:hypothetical protein